MTVYFSTRDFFRRFPDDAACLAALLRLRLGARAACPKCGRALHPAPLAGRTGHGCPRCGHHVHPMAGTAFDRSRVPLQFWFYAVFLAAQGRRAPPARRLQRRLGVSYPTARRMAGAIADALAAEGGPPPVARELDAELLALTGAPPPGRRRRAGGAARASAASSRSKARASARHSS